MKFTKIVITLLSTVLFLSHRAQAQMWGTGFYGGASSASGCSGGPDIGDEATSLQDDIDGLKEELKEIQDRKKEARDDFNKVKSDRDRGMRKVQTYGLKSDAFNFVKTHIESGTSCCQYKNFNCDGQKVSGCMTLEACNTKNSTSVTPGIGPNKGSIDFETFGAIDEWSRSCDGNHVGKVLPGEVCSIKNKIETLYKKDECIDGLKTWQEAEEKYKKKDEALQALNDAEAKIKAALKDTQKAQKKAYKEYLKDQRESQTEGGCVECMLAGNGYVPQQRKVQTGEIIGNVALGLGAMFMGNQLNKYVSDNNTKLGFQTNAYPAFGYGFPYFMAGLYGAMGGGGGSGAFACGGGMGGMNGGMGGGGAFGYPGGMMGSPMGGGMYMPGMGPWGMAGPWGNGGGMGMGGGMPMGMMMGGGIGMMSPMGMMAGGGMGMMSPMGMMMGGGMGMPMGGGMGMMSPMGMMAGGGLGMMSPMGMMMGGGMGMPMGGGMGMMAGGGMGMMSPMGMMAGGMGVGMPMGMMSPMGMMAGGGMGMMSPYGMMAGGGMGMPMGGMMNSGMMGGMPMGGMDGGAAQMQMQMQMQQQAMQMQMQQYQSMMQAQQQAQQQAMQKAQVLSGLQQELYTLMYRIQQVQTSTSTGGYLGFGNNTGTIQPAGYPAPGYSSPGSAPTTAPGSNR